MKKFNEKLGNSAHIKNFLFFFASTRAKKISFADKDMKRKFQFIRNSRMKQQHLLLTKRKRIL